MTFQFDIPNSGTPMLAQQIQDQFNALGVTNYTADDTKPDNPRDGMLRVYAPDSSNTYFQVYLGGTWITLYENISSSTGNAATKTQQFTSLNTWQFDHNLTRRPLVQVYDVSWGKLEPLQISHPTVNRVMVFHAGLESGHIIVVG